MTSAKNQRAILGRGKNSKSRGHGKRWHNPYLTKERRLAEDKTRQATMTAIASEREQLDAWLAEVQERERKDAAFRAGLETPGPWERGMGEAAAAELRADILARNRWVSRTIHEAADLVAQGYTLERASKMSGHPWEDIAAEVRRRRELARPQFGTHR